MRKRIFSLIVLILVAVCGGIFAACGSGGGENVSVSIESGLDSQLSAEKADSISSELSLSEEEKENFLAGKGYNNSVESGNAVSLVVGSQANSSREILVKINNFSDDMSGKVFFSSDSSCISISEVSVLSGGLAKATITALSAGTAEIVVTSGQYFKTTSIVVKVTQKLESFSVKTNAVIYLEKGKEIEINAEDYINFFPVETNMREVEFYDGETLLTKDGKTILSAMESETATGIVPTSRELTIKSKRLVGNSSIQTISVVVLDNVSNLSMKKMVYSEDEKTYVQLDNGKTITVIRNVSNGEKNYGVRELFVVVDCAEENLEIVAQALETNLLVIPVGKERITQTNYLTSVYKDIIEAKEGEFSTWVFKFELKYEGISSYTLEFGFNVNIYSYNERITAKVEFKSASNLIEFEKSGESGGEPYVIYDTYSGTFGTKFVISTNTSDEFSKAKVLLLLPAETDSAIKVFDLNGIEKTSTNYAEYSRISLKSGENFYIKANNGQVGTFQLIARVSYTFEGVDFVTDKTITLEAVNSPSDFSFNTSLGAELTSYVFDLNTSGKIATGINSTQTYAARNTLTLYLNGFVGSGASTGVITDFAVSSNVSIIQYSKSSNSITLTATGVGTGSITVVVGNGISKTFNFSVIRSVSQANAKLPSVEQNNNIIALLTNYSHNSIIYGQYAIVKKGSQIPLSISATGNVDSISVEGINYVNGKISTNEEISKQEIVVSISYSYVFEDLIQTRTVEIQKILISSIVEIENFSLSTSYGTNSFSLYDYSSVGYNSKNLSMATIYLSVLPEDIQEEVFETVNFSTNLSGATFIDNAETGIFTLTTNAFVFTFYRTGPSAGTGTILCNVTDSGLYDDNGNFSFGKIAIVASISRGEIGGTFTKTIQFEVKKATKVDLISSQTKSIELDIFTNSKQIEVSTYPIEATNSALSYQFVPRTSGLTEGDIIINQTQAGVKLTLREDLDAAGEGILRIIALDSYTSSNNFTTYIDIPVTISNGSEQYPYYINFESDVQKMIQTNFAKYYIIAGEIDLKDVQWESSKYVLSGGITGKSNAKLINFDINSVYWDEETKEGDKEYLCGMFKEISSGAFIKDVSFEFDKISLDLTENQELTGVFIGYVGTIAAKNNGTLENISVKFNEIEIITGYSYTLNVGGIVGQNARTISNSITSSTKNTILSDGKIKIIDKTFVENASESANYSHTLFVGGVAGKNIGGRIERKIANGIIEFNNAFVTAKVDIEISYEHEVIVSSKNNEAIGGIVGYNNSASSALSQEQRGLYNLSAVGEISASKFNAVGGIAGQNEGKIQKALTQVYVIGKNNVGGAVGINNKGVISEIAVENLFNSSKTGDLAALVCGQNNVGGIIGKACDETSLTTSSFISYLSSGNDLISNGNYGLIVGLQEDGSTITIDYVVAIGKTKVNPIEKTVLLNKFTINNVEYNAVYNSDDPAKIIKLVYEYGETIERPINDDKFRLVPGGIQYTIVYEDEIPTKLTYEIDEVLYEILIDHDKFIIDSIEYEIIDDVVETNQRSIDVVSDGFSIDGIQYVIDYSDGVVVKTIVSEAAIVPDNYAIYSETTKTGGTASGKTIVELKDVEGFEFIFIPSSTISLELTEEYENNEMTTTSEDNLALYLFLYESSKIDVLDKNIVQISKVFNSTLGEVTASYNRYTITSSNPSVLTIENGNFVIKGTGVSTLTIKSRYVSEVSQTIYVYVTNYTNNLIIYTNATKAKEIKTSPSINLFEATESKLIYFDFLDKYNVDGFTIPNQVKVLFKIVRSNGTEVNYVLKAGDEKLANVVFSLIKISQDSYQIAVSGEIGNYEIEIVPYLEVDINGKIYTNMEIKNTDNEDVKVETLFKFENTTKSIYVSKDYITTEPYYEKVVQATVTSLKTDEVITISVIPVDKNGKELSNSQIAALDFGVGITATYGNLVYENKLSEAYIYTFNFNMNCKVNNKFSLSIKFDKNTLITKTQYYIVKISSSNGKFSTLNLCFEPQNLISISTELYPITSKEEREVYNFTESFSYIPSGVIIPGQNSLLEFVLTPSYVYFDSIEVVNAPSNEYKLVFDLFDRTENKVVQGATPIANGISVSRNLISNGRFALRTFADQEMADNSFAKVYIILRDANGNQIGEIIEKTFYIEHLPGVSLTVDGVSSGNTSPVLLAQGLTYDLDVWVKGYSTGNFTNSGSLITDGQIVFEIEGSDLILISKNSDGSYKLKTTSSALTENRTVIIKSYGINSKGERSRETILKIEIVQFVVKTDNIGDIISNVVNNVYSSATGNSYIFEVSLNSKILIYDKTNEGVKNAVNNFLNGLSSQAKNFWEFKDYGENLPTFKTIGKNVYITKSGIFRLSYNEVTEKVVIKFLKTESSSVPTLQIRYTGKFYYNAKGTPTVLTSPVSENVYTLSQTFGFDIAEKTTLRNPYPIYTYEDILDMRKDNFYILMNDITLPDNFTPIKTEIGGFDGNNHKIIVPTMSIKSNSTSENLNFGIFETTTEDAILKNIIIYINGSVNLSIYNYSSVTYGLLVGENYGTITNCAIEGTNYPIVNLNLFGTNSSSTVSCEIGGLVGINNGNITNSRIEVGISVNSVSNSSIGFLSGNLGGFVGINDGSATIASCYINGRVENNTAGSVSAITAGFVAQNNFGSRIFASYISGDLTYIEETDKDPHDAIKIVYSTAGASAFVYNNAGTISNCFSNIPVKANDGTSGFVFQNQKNGEILNCYSVSALENSAKNGSFIGVLTGVTQEEDPILNFGKIVDCFAWEETSGINSGLASNSGVSGLTIIDKSKFGRGNATFEKYAFSNTSKKADGVWFWATDTGETEFFKNGMQMHFSTAIPQLVSPNTISTGSVELIDTIYDALTETTEYKYASIDFNYEEGSKFNPYVIATEEDLEYLVSQSGFTNGTIIKEIYCRLVGDIIYESSTVSSGLYKYSFLGNLEGNSYTIGNYVLDSSAKMDNGGFFATIGTASNNGGSVKNTTFAPRYMSLTNCNAVGAVAGTIYGGTLVNIIIDGTTYSSETQGLTIIGKNAVGGVVGVAEGTFNFNNITSNISVNSTYRAELNDHPTGEYLKTSLSRISYSGLIAGIVNGYGTAIYIDVYGNNVSVAEHASLMFGYVGKDVVAKNLTATGAINQSIKADIYGGVIAAQNLGTLKEIEVVGYSSSLNGFFAVSSYNPISIGNLVGLMTNGTIQNAVVISKIKAQASVEALGGAVGTLSAGTLENIVVIGDIIGGNRIGGIVGQIVKDYNEIQLINCIHSGVITSNSSSEIVTIGTLIGYVAGYNDGDIGTKIKITSTELIMSSDRKTFTVNNTARKFYYSGEYINRVNITTYATSAGEIYYGAYVTVDGDSTRKVENSNPSYSQYIISDADKTIYVPLLSKWKENDNIINK